jgi:outer membrane cobalamin receptor
MLKVIRSYLPILVGIAVAVASLALTHGANAAQEIRKMETIVVTAKRLPRQHKVVKMETIVVTANREKPVKRLAAQALASR